MLSLLQSWDRTLISRLSFNTQSLVRSPTWSKKTRTTPVSASKKLWASFRQTWLSSMLKEKTSKPFIISSVRVTIETRFTSIIMKSTPSSKDKPTNKFAKSQWPWFMRIVESLSKHSSSGNSSKQKRGVPRLWLFWEIKRLPRRTWYGNTSPGY